MDVSIYLSKKVKVDLTNGFYYEGVVIDTDEDSLVLRDKTNQIVSISIKTISFIREVSE